MYLFNRKSGFRGDNCQRIWFSSILVGMATKNTFLSLLLICLPVVAASVNEDRDSFTQRRKFTESRYEDFFIHYNNAYRFEELKEQGRAEIRDKALAIEKQKNQARLEQVRTRKPPRIYTSFEDGSGPRPDEQKKELARREFVQHQQVLKRIESAGPRIPESIESGLINPLEQR